MSPDIHLRPATADDRAFVDDLLYRTMRGYVEATWPNDPEAWRHYYQINAFDPKNTRMIQVDGKDIGRLSTTIRPDCVFIDEIHIVPQYQKQGIGRQVIGQVFREAARRHLPVKATVLMVNKPSQQMLFSMGFTIVAEKDHRFHVQYLPSIDGTMSAQPPKPCS